MMTLYPMMSLKRKLEIRRALDEWRTRPGTGIRNRAKTHCPQGHPYDAANTLTVVTPTGTGRQCRACHTAWWAKNRGRYRRSAAP